MRITKVFATWVALLIVTLAIMHSVQSPDRVQASSSKLGFELRNQRQAELRSLAKNIRGDIRPVHELKTFAPDLDALIEAEVAARRKEFRKCRDTMRIPAARGNELVEVSFQLLPTTMKATVSSPAIERSTIRLGAKTEQCILNVLAGTAVTLPPLTLPMERVSYVICFSARDND